MTWKNLKMKFQIFPNNILDHLDLDLALGGDLDLDLVLGGDLDLDLALGDGDLDLALGDGDLDLALGDGDLDLGGGGGTLGLGDLDLDLDLSLAALASSPPPLLLPRGTSGGAWRNECSSILKSCSRLSVSTSRIFSGSNELASPKSMIRGFPSAPRSMLNLCKSL